MARTWATHHLCIVHTGVTLQFTALLLWDTALEMPGAKRSALATAAISFRFDDSSGQLSQFYVQTFAVSFRCAGPYKEGIGFVVITEKLGIVNSSDNSDSATLLLMFPNF